MSEGQEKLSEFPYVLSVINIMDPKLDEVVKEEINETSGTLA